MFKKLKQLADNSIFSLGGYLLSTTDNLLYEEMLREFHNDKDDLEIVLYNIKEENIKNNEDLNNFLNTDYFS